MNPSPNVGTFMCMLKACSTLRAIEKGIQVHLEIVRKQLLHKCASLGNALVDMYAKCGALSMACTVLEELPVRNVVSWNALITGYCQHGHACEALSCFDRMQDEGVSPSIVTFSGILKACASMKAAEKGSEVHGEIVTKGLLAKSLVLGNALVDMYAKCGALFKAETVFNELLVRNVVTWNALIGGYSQHGCNEEALNCFKKMKDEGYSPDVVTFLCTLKACGGLGASEKGNRIHSEIVGMGLAEISMLGNALVGMYAKCGSLKKAQQVFDELPFQDVVSWSALITGYCQHTHEEDALDLFEGMESKGFSPDALTFSSILKACGNIGAAEKGKKVHLEVVRKGLLEDNTVLGSALVDMYAKCGALVRAQAAFDEIAIPNVVSWTALISGYSENGHGKEALKRFERMRDEGFSPDTVTIACILKACSSIGAAGKGQTYFEAMGTRYGIIPTLQHQTCLVDLLSRAGHLKMAMEMMKKMPSYYMPVLYAFLGACRKWGGLELGREAFQNVAERLDRKPGVAFVV